MGWAALHEELARLDPDAAARIHPNDPQRIQRALEVCHHDGPRISELQRTQRKRASALSRCAAGLSFPADGRMLQSHLEEALQRR